MPLLHPIPELVEVARASGRDDEKILELCVELTEIADRHADEMRAARAARGEDITRNPRQPDIAQLLFNGLYDAVAASLSRADASAQTDVD